MIAMSFRTFITKVLVFIFIKPPLYKRFGRHSTTNIPKAIIPNICSWHNTFTLNFDNLENILSFKNGDVFQVSDYDLSQCNDHNEKRRLYARILDANKNLKKDVIFFS